MGELFIIRNAGNIIGDFEIGSAEYASEHLGVELIVVLGHTHCGAVDATVRNQGHSYIKSITEKKFQKLLELKRPTKGRSIKCKIWCRMFEKK